MYRALHYTRHNSVRHFFIMVMTSDSGVAIPWPTSACTLYTVNFPTICSSHDYNFYDESGTKRRVQLIY